MEADLGRLARIVENEASILEKQRPRPTQPDLRFAICAR
jgi:hypothetical protein